MILDCKTSYYLFVVTNANFTWFHIDIAVNIKDSLSKTRIGNTANNLVYWEKYEHAEEALIRQEQLQSLSRRKLTKIIAGQNPSLQTISLDLVN